MFGISFSEIAVIAVVTLIVVGPHKLPTMLRTVGQTLGKLRRLTTEVRQQTGIDDILREEGLAGGITELRSIMRGDIRSWATGKARSAAGAAAAAVEDPYVSAMETDHTREYPLEGPDAYDALPDDLVGLAGDADGPKAEDAPDEGEAPA